MLKLLLFLLILPFSQTLWAAPQCSAFLQTASISTLSSLKPHSLRRAVPQPWDIAEHGFIIEHTTTKGVKAVLKTLATRDGTYPLIIDSQQNLVIDHRLPESAFDDVNATAFVGNHLGLYNKLRTHLGQTPSVVFAGQIRVVGGRVKSLIDQSGSFYFLPEDMGFSGENKTDLLIEHNQNRLELATVLLNRLKITSAATHVKNFLKAFRNYNDLDLKNDGHVLAKDAARFERLCRNSAGCWSKHQKIESSLRSLFQKFDNESQIKSFLVKKRKEKSEVISFETLQIWLMILSEGTTELLSKPGALDPNTDIGGMLNDLIQNLDALEI